MFFFALPVSAEQIDLYDVDVRIGDHGTVEVVERIHVDFGDEERNGLVRSVPFEVMRDGKTHEIRISDVSVRDSVGREVVYSTVRKDGFIDVFMGGSVVTGMQEYVLSYTLDGVVYYLDTFDEFTWYAVGADWLFPINEVRVRVMLPEPIAASQMKIGCMLVSRDGHVDCHEVKYENRDDETVQNIVASDTLVPEGHGVLVALQIPKGVVAGARPVSQVLWWMMDHWLTLAAGVVVLGVFFIGAKRKI